MKSLIKVMLILALGFASTLLILKALGILDAQQIESWLRHAQTLSPFYTGGLAVLLLSADLFVAMPTLTITILSGFLLGHLGGALSAILGMMFAGCIGFFMGRRYGEKLLMFLLKDQNKLDDVRTAFQRQGLMMIILSRAVPILPEVTACLAGTTGMTFSRFLVAWSVNTIPYCLIATYSGSISTIEDPKPAIITAVLLTAFFWLGWLVFRKLVLKQTLSLSDN
ncbi:hypothetical protein CS022_14075 [Veronia nyctiphanis]|uniref:TVP38/TMEM64 family membrane protein n=1 Tax=Veronia nyctiphanis TaxID=1278244 RepID=A0A4V1LSS9_9GAMM|nr:VTT domain-containing protein [Veronia nyctiphanis]RXJ72758.1 hypothetical protein CS022_14075 [Veronia nyctiphanis]